MANVRQAIENIVGTIVTGQDINLNDLFPSYSYAEDKEFNFSADNIGFDNAHVRLREIEEGSIRIESGGHYDDYVVFLQFLKLSEFDLSSSQHDEIVEAMRLLCSRFMVAYNNYRVGGVSQFEEIESVQLISLFNVNDVNVSGVEARFTVKALKPRGVC